MTWLNPDGYTVQEDIKDEYQVTAQGITAKREFIVSSPKIFAPQITNQRILAGCLIQDDIPKIGDPYDDSVGSYPWPVCVSIDVKEEMNGESENLKIFRVVCEYEVAIKNEELSLIAWQDGLTQYEVTTDLERVYYEGTEGSVFIESSKLSARYGGGVDSVIIGESEDGSIQGVNIRDFSSVLIVEKYFKGEDLQPTDPPGPDGSPMQIILGARGKINSTDFYGHPAGECLCISVRELGRTDKIGIGNFKQPLIKMEFRFAISKNLEQTDLPTFKDEDDADINITAGKKGHQYLWVKSKTISDVDKTKVVTEKVQVHDVYLGEEDLATTTGLSGVEPTYEDYP